MQQTFFVPAVVTVNERRVSPCHVTAVVFSFVCSAAFVAAALTPWTVVESVGDVVDIYAKPFTLCLEAGSSAADQAGSKNCETWSSMGATATNLLWCAYAEGDSSTTESSSSGGTTTTTTTTYGGPKPHTLLQVNQAAIVIATISCVVFTILLGLYAGKLIRFLWPVVVGIGAVVAGSAAVIAWIGIQHACPGDQTFCHRIVTDSTIMGAGIVSSCGPGAGIVLAGISTILTMILLCCVGCCCGGFCGAQQRVAVQAVMPSAPREGIQYQAFPAQQQDQELYGNGTQ